MLSINVKRYKVADFKAFGEDQADIGNLISNAIAEAYAKFLRERYLSGQVLAIRTAETVRSVKFFKLKKGVFGVRPGYGIRGRLNYLYRFERGARPFMGPSFAAFKASGEHREIMVRIYNAMMKKKLGR